MFHTPHPRLQSGGVPGCLREARDTVIVATSTLELGIDVGDLDRVVQINSTRTVASSVQKLGRTGRRAGITYSKRAVFLAHAPFCYAL
jgi:Lhr-like helicase